MTSSHLFSGQKSSPYLTQYLLRHLLNGGQVGDLRLNPAQLDRQAIEDHIYGNHDKPSVVYPQTQERIKKINRLHIFKMGRLGYYILLLFHLYHIDNHR